MTSRTPSQSTWDHEKSLLLIIEADLRSRFAYVEEVLCKDKHVLPLKNVTKTNLLSTLIARVRLRHDVYQEYKKLKDKLSKYRFIFLSNTEGFIAQNIARWIRRDFPRVTVLALQHGIFLENNRKRTALILCLNRLTEFVMDYSVAGSGFINQAVDFNIVYNNWYKSLMVSRGVGRDRVIVSSFMLKGEKFFDSRKRPSLNNRTALVLLQCLSALGISDRESEVRLIDAVVNWLCEQYDVVLIKQHPYCHIEIARVPGNCRFVDGDIADIAKDCGTAISFFSEALLECEFLGLRTIAIRDGSLNVKPEVYRLFNEVADVLEDGTLLLRKNARAFSAYYESEIETTEELLAALGANISSGDLGSEVRNLDSER